MYFFGDQIQIKHESRRTTDLPQMIPRVKIAILGDSRTGKTSFVRRFESFKFQDDNDARHDDDVTTPPPKTADPERRSHTDNAGIAAGAARKLPGDLESDLLQNYVSFDHVTRYKAGDWSKSRCHVTDCTVALRRRNKHNERLLEMADLSILEAPAFARFPLSSLEEWDESGAVGVRSADAFVILYDVTKGDSFRYVRRIREGILQSFLPRQTSPSGRGFLIRSSLHSKSGARNSASTSRRSFINTRGGEFISSFRSRFQPTLEDPRRHSIGNGLLGVMPSILLTSVGRGSQPDLDIDPRPRVYPPVIMVVGNKCDLVVCTCRRCCENSELAPCGHRAESNRVVKAREVASLVRKAWKCLYMDCSNKMNWNVHCAMKEVVNAALDAIEKSKRRD